MMDKNSIVTGLVLGGIVPVLGFIVVQFILIGICFNLIPFNISKNNRWDQTMRGIVFPTLVYVGAWLFRFYSELFG